MKKSKNWNEIEVDRMILTKKANSANKKTNKTNCIHRKAFCII